jgi:hypothetical protein
MKTITFSVPIFIYKVQKLEYQKKTIIEFIK